MPWRWLILWLMLALGMLAYLDLVGYPEARQRMGSTGLAPDNGVGLFPPWYASKELLLAGRDPYSGTVAAETQQMVYGRAAETTEGSLIRDEHRFAYPLYVSLLLAPTVLLPFGGAQMLVLLVLLAATAMSVPWWLRGLGVNASLGTTLLLISAIFGSLAVQQGLHLQQLGMLVAALMAAAVAAAATGKHGLAGVLLGVATIKPHIAAGVTAWLLLWSLGEFRRRRGLLVGFLVTLSLLIAGAALLMPDWISRWRSVVAAYPSYTAAKSLSAAIFGKWSTALAIAAGAALASTWWRYRKAEPAGHEFAEVVLITLAVQMMLIPTWIGHNQLLLLPIALIAALRAPQFWTAGVWPKLILAASVLTLAWERFTAAGLALLEVSGLLKSPSPMTVALPVYPLFAFPFLGLLLAIANALDARTAHAATK